MTGAPRNLVIDGDFVLLRMALIDEVGLPAAVVFQRIAWRCDIRPEGWTASLDELATECHLGKDQVKRATKILRDRGWVTADRLDRWDPTLSWRVVWDPASREAGNPPHEQQGTTPTQERETTSTSTEDVETSEDQSLLNPDPVEAEFEGFWRTYPRRVGRARALASYRKARKTATELEIAGGLHAQLPDLTARDLDKVPHPTTWLNQRRWEDDPAHAAQPGDRLRQREGLPGSDDGRFAMTAGPGERINW